MTRMLNSIVDGIKSFLENINISLTATPQQKTRKFGQEVLFYLKTHNKSVDHLADSIGLASSTTSEMLRGKEKTPLTRDKAERIINALLQFECINEEEANKLRKMKAWEKNNHNVYILPAVISLVFLIFISVVLFLVFSFPQKGNVQTTNQSNLSSLQSLDYTQSNCSITLENAQALIKVPNLEVVPKEPCAFAWRSDNSYVEEICPENWICEVFTLSNETILQKGKNQKTKIKGGTWRYTPDYPKTDQIRDFCKFAQNVQKKMPDDKHLILEGANCS